jgi:hypothetical protein
MFSFLIFNYFEKPTIDFMFFDIIVTNIKK